MMAYGVRWLAKRRAPCTRCVSASRRTRALHSPHVHASLPRELNVSPIILPMVPGCHCPRPERVGVPSWFSVLAICWKLTPVSRSRRTRSRAASRSGLSLLGRCWVVDGLPSRATTRAASASIWICRPLPGRPVLPVGAQADQRPQDDVGHGLAGMGQRPDALTGTVRET